MDIDTKVSDLPSVGPFFTTRLKKLKVESIRDLLYHAPSHYLDFSQKKKINELTFGEKGTIEGQIVAIKNVYARSGKIIQKASLSDGQKEIPLVWFNQPYLVKTIPPGSLISVSGKVGTWDRQPAIISPEFEKLFSQKEALHTGRVVAIYPETEGVSSKRLRRLVKAALELTKGKISDPLPKKTIKRYRLLALEAAFWTTHFPKNAEDPEKGRERLAFDELLALHLASLRRKKAWAENKNVSTVKVDGAAVKKFVDSLGFKLTRAQEKASEEILADLEGERPMNRLLEGDVGSGKTVVAAMAIFCCFLEGFQSALMAPTQLLANQHYQTLKDLLAPFGVRISLITATKTQKELGRNDLFVGTHALIHRQLDTKDLALIVIDEQQRFGVEQRTHLIKKTARGSFSPHVLTMTATPIPRTIALTLYGDLELSLIDEMPQGRALTKTRLVPRSKSELAYTWIKRRVKMQKDQAFIVCPIIEESEKDSMKQVKAATKEYDRLKKRFKDLKFGLLHGRQKVNEREKTLETFKDGRIDILVTTPVVEVGLDIPNATIMAIEGAERFGLSQLHQLRGRVGRGGKPSYCLLFTKSSSPKVNQRLKALTKKLSGFELAELDLKMRGPGEVFGTRQHGFPDLKVASWQDTALIIKAKKAAQEIVEEYDLEKRFAKALINS